MIKNLIKSILKHFILFIFKLLDCFPIQKRTILIQTVDPLLFTDNTMYLFLYLSKKKNLNTYWITNSLRISRFLKKKKLNFINPKLNIFNYFFQLYKSKIIIDAGTKYFNPLGITDNLKKIKITTGHGLGLKTVPGKKTRRMEIKDFNKFDYVNYTSEFTKKIIGKKLFKTENKKLIILGYPRYDQYFKKKRLYTSKKKKSISKSLTNFTLKKNSKIIYYTPTWRTYDYKLPLKEFKNFDFKEFDKFLEKNNYYFFYTKHYKTNEDKMPSFKRIFEIDRNVYTMFDSSMFLNEVDLLLNDYSTTSTAASILEIPQIFIMPDYEKYKKAKGFVENYKNNLIGPEAKNYNDLKNLIKFYLIKKSNYSKPFKQKLKNYKKKYYDFKEINNSANKYYELINKII